MPMSQLDPGQVIKTAFEDATGALKVRGIAGALVPERYDQIDLTYVPSGNGVGEIQTAVYKLATVTVATLTLSYNASNKLTSVVRT